ncbi:hypothetical protein DPEC_G00135370 [Dallia pectoralis]|uniref:Uncharacterized protein n=1 Tax=Dallia pectoralis TaxID=75939 RepID=A0ACC2GLT1_DALPE|nr:hypothetical protein DPEC_G00135370 [Dallia pectoralis]
MRARLSDERTESILSALRLCRPPCRRRVQEIMSLLGLMSAAHAVVTLGLLHMRALQRWFARQRVDPVRHRRRMLIIPYTLAGDLDYWRNPAVLERGVPLGRVSAMTQVFTDASLTGWGGEEPTPHQPVGTENSSVGSDPFCPEATGPGCTDSVRQPGLLYSTKRRRDCGCGHTDTCVLCQRYSYPADRMWGQT